MPKVGILSISVRITGTAYSPVAAGSPGPFDRKMPSGLSARMSAADVLRRHHRHPAAIAGELAQDVALDAVIDGDDVEFRLVHFAVALAPLPRRLLPGEALAVVTIGTRSMPTSPGHAFASRLSASTIEAAGRLVRDHRVRHALLADERGERAGVDAGKPDDAAALEPLVEMARGAIIRRRGDGRVQNDAARAGRRRKVDGLDVVLVGADIADVGKSEGDDLARHRTDR